MPTFVAVFNRFCSPHQKKIKCTFKLIQRRSPCARRQSDCERFFKKKKKFLYFVAKIQMPPSLWLVSYQIDSINLIAPYLSFFKYGC